MCQLITAALGLKHEGSTPANRMGLFIRTHDAEVQAESTRRTKPPTHTLVKVVCSHPSDQPTWGPSWSSVQLPSGGSKTHARAARCRVRTLVPADRLYVVRVPLSVLGALAQLEAGIGVTLAGRTAYLEAWLCFSSPEGMELSLLNLAGDEVAVRARLLELSMRALPALLACPLQVPMRAPAAKFAVSLEPPMGTRVTGATLRTHAPMGARTASGTTPFHAPMRARSASGTVLFQVPMLAWRAFGAVSSHEPMWTGTTHLALTCLPLAMWAPLVCPHPPNRRGLLHLHLVPSRENRAREYSNKS